MSRGTRLGLIVAALAAAGVLVSWPSHADPPASDTTSASVVCSPFNTPNMFDGGGAGTVVECGSGFRALMMETESASPAYLCGTVGCTLANYTAAGLKRCVGCSNGSAFTMDGNRGTVKCVGGTADAGIVFAVHCAR